ncbi:alpha/beta hydrolase domain-containing protein [uncultured Alsobacter sp.]|uniref:alpha/beta hydrolase domain-containing protein n=1 Tax=uncultured Alsobacter sp. TaxID=1748258 RepID=UPI0025CD8808|nr:alpha/beta hydrolase domain-containing protein [uncultured Alsobacter sp.]
MSVTFEILAREPFADGHAFGNAGAYERIDARAHVAVDPAHPAQAGVFDIDRAPRDGQGLVRCSIDLWLLKPVQPERGNGALVVEFPNRGNKRCLQFFNDAPATNEPRTVAHAGNGWLMREGYAAMVVGWQGDVLEGDGRLVADLPVATDGDRPLTARVRAEFISDSPGVTCLPLSGKNGTRSLPTVSRDTAQAEFRRRRYPGSAPEPIAADRWRFARMEGGGRGGQGDVTGAERAVVPSSEHILFPEGFEPGWIYELVYTARDPLVLDMGFVAMRELVSALRAGEGEALGLGAPAAPARLYAWGRSQSGRAIRDFIHRGFNADASGRKVFDGVISHIAGGGRTAMNRFSNLVIAASRQYEDWLNPADRFPFSYATSTDHNTGERDGICKRPETDPLVIHTQSASEYWHRRGSLVHTDSQGNDLAQPDTVRIYFWSSSQHWSDPSPFRPEKGICQNYQNVVATSPLFRSTLALLDAWVKDGVPPPESRIPRRADGTLLTMAQWRAQFPAIPGTALPASPNELPFIDYGPGFSAGEAAAEPPSIDVERGYAVMVPGVDATGNDAAGIRMPMVEAPLGTYTGWNLRIAGHGHGALHDFSGSYIPLPESADERLMTGDPRPSILERYGSCRGYVSAVGAAARALADQRLLLEEDVARVTAAAQNWGRPRHILGLSQKD